MSRWIYAVSAWLREPLQMLLLTFVSAGMLVGLAVTSALLSV